MRVGLLSDTHGYLDEAVFSYFSECDEIWHAGDIGNFEVYESLKTFKPVRAVYGNIDSGLLRTELPGEIEWECNGVRIYMTHIGGHPGKYDKAARVQLDRRKPDLFICGHSHVLRVARDPERKLLYFNPGACGRHGWHSVRTVLRFTISSAKVSAVEAIELGPRVNARR